MDQSLFAAPHGLSQRITSFIASQRQGIHRIPLRHLIVLMIDVRFLAKTVISQKDQFLVDISEAGRGRITGGQSPRLFRSMKPERP
jgi:hypothetical protein